MLKSIKFVLQLLMFGMVIGLMLAVPQMVHQHQTVLKACEMMMGVAQKEGQVTLKTYRAFESALAQVGMEDQVQGVVLHPGLDMPVQKRMAMSVELVIIYEIQVPFVGIKRYAGDQLCMQVYSHKYFK